VDPSSKDYSKFTPEVAERIDILKPNEIETEMLTGVKIRTPEDTLKAIHILKGKGVKMPIVSLGEHGVMYEYNGEPVSVEGIKVNAVDTTAAGDTFIGGMAAQLSRGRSLCDSVNYANRAAAYCVCRRGAQIAIPYERNVI
jgi:ribokinase